MYTCTHVHIQKEKETEREMEIWPKYNSEKHKLKINILIPIFSIFYIDYVLLLYFKMFLLNQLKYHPTKSISLFLERIDSKVSLFIQPMPIYAHSSFLPL